MRVLVYPHDLNMGGSQLNAIQIAAAVQRQGHESVLYGQPGPLVKLIADYGLEFVSSPDPGRRPSARVATDLARLVAARDIDIVHGYEWPPALEAHLATRRSGARAVGTVMSMSVAPFLPRSMPLVVGTEQIAAAERASGRTDVTVIEPPVDLDVDGSEHLLDVTGFRRRWGLDETPTVVCVTRLAAQLKLEGILSAILAVGEIRSTRPVRLLVVGGGAARPQVERLAAEVNTRVGEGTVILTGELADPRAAYAAADIALGMGGSALRAMAFSKPLVVQGEGGFWRLLTPESLSQFLWAGWYGYGGDGRDAVAELKPALLELLESPARRRELGAFARRTVEGRFSTASAAQRQIAVYESLLGRGPTPRASRLSDEARSVLTFGQYHVRRRLSRLSGRRATDDFNARPVAREGREPPAAPRRDAAIVYFAGVSWDAVAGTDRHLAQALARTRRVLWVDPPMSWTAQRRRGLHLHRLSVAAPGVLRTSTTCPPGVTRPGLRKVARLMTSARAWSAVRASGLTVDAFVVSAGEQQFPRWARGATRLYFETDDFVAGAGIFGTSTAYAKRSRAGNVKDCDAVMAVTSELLESVMGTESSRPALVLPNGCDPEHYRQLERVELTGEITLAPPVAGLLGQLNERIDLACLEAVADAGASLLLVGPRYEESLETRARLDHLLARDNVQWVGRQPFERLPGFMSVMTVGLTPYADTAFNRASYPLKTLEYLAAGRPVVTTDLPAARQLGTDLVTIAGTPSEFASMTLAALSAPTSREERDRRIDFARANSWEQRAAQVEALLASCRPGGPAEERR